MEVVVEVKILKAIKKIIVGILGIAFFAFAITMTILLLNYNTRGVTQFGETSLVLVKGEISSETYKKGDLVIVEGKKVKNISVGDEIFVYRLENEGAVSIDVGIVGEVYPEDRNITFENGETYKEEFIIGETSKIYNKIGGYLAIIESTVGFLFMVIVPSFLIFVYQLYALIIEIKYGREEQSIK
jgi:hypothetical protein